MKFKFNLSWIKISVLLASATILMGLFLFWMEAGRIKDRLGEVRSKSFVQLSTNLSIPTKLNDSISISKMMNDFILISDLLYVSVRNIDDYLLYQNGTTGLCRKHDMNRQLIVYDNESAGNIIYCFKDDEQNNLELTAFVILCVFIGLLSLVILYIKRVTSRVESSLAKFFDFLDNIDVSDIEQSSVYNNNSTDSYLAPAFGKVNELLRTIFSSFTELSRTREIESKVKISRQLAHDIRSPLAALDVSVKSLNLIDPSQKNLIRTAINRIHDIANSLSGKSGDLNKAELTQTEPVLLYSVIASILSEKRTEYRGTSKLTLDFLFDHSNYGLYSIISPFELKRVISNLINNSVEAIFDKEGFVEVSLKSTSKQNEIIVKDNGPGIQKKIIETIFEDGKSFGKEDGTGLGLSHAKNTIESWGGTIDCLSSPGIETVFTIKLPRIDPPLRFVESINLNKTSKIIIVDDDSSIHNVWKGRLESVNIDLKNVFMFTSPTSFKSWYKDNSEFSMIYLLDYEFLNHEINGLDLANMVSGNNIYLVTSRFEEDHIKAACEEKGIHLVDKGMIGFVPIKCESQGNEFIFIDDDELIQMSWKMEAEKCGVSLSCYSSVQEFISSSSKYSKDIKIYIDSNLANNKKGEIESEKIYDLGFKNLYLATGYSKEDIDKPSWIIDIVGKRADFS